MKRTALTLSEITRFDNLLLASWKASRGKRERPDVSRFLARLDDSLNQLAQDSLSGCAPYGKYRSFQIFDPKQRLIHAACFEDRVLHHAIMNLAEFVFERTLVPSTYACRPGKGVHKAVSHVQHNLQRFPWFAKVDIKGYFPAIDQQRLKQLLRRRFKGNDFLALLDRIIHSYQAQPGKGLPIGSLTSQHFANYYLDGADRFLLAHPDVVGHVRYMDDIIWWGETKDAIKRVLKALKSYLADECFLQLKDNAQINRSVRGVTYCGYRVLQGVIRLTPRKKVRYRRLHAQNEQAWLDGDIDSLALQSGYDAIHAMTLHADSVNWRRKHLTLYPSRYDTV